MKKEDEEWWRKKNEGWGEIKRNKEERGRMKMNDECRRMKNEKNDENDGEWWGMMKNDEKRRRMEKEKGVKKSEEE
jgi:hypothetical protein